MAGKTAIIANSIHRQLHNLRMFADMQPDLVRVKVDQFMEGQEALTRMEVRRELQRRLYCDIRVEELHRFQRETGALTNNPPPSAALTGLIWLLRTVPFDPAYEAHMEQSRERFVTRLRNDNEVQSAIQEWVGYGVTQRRELLKRLAGVQDEMFSHASYQFQPARMFTFGYSRNDPEEPSHNYGTIYLNASDHLRWHRFADMLADTAHAKSYDHLCQVARMISQGLIPVDSPFYRQGHLYMDYTMEVTRYGAVYNTESEIHDVHPIERDAWRTADAIRRMFDVNGKIMPFPGQG